MIAALIAALVATPPSALSEPQLDATLSRVHALPLAKRIGELSAMFLGTPYGEQPLGEGGTGPEPQARWRTDQVDCQTYVETVLAMANARSVAEAKTVLDDIRYQGEPSFENRNHFTEAQWLPVNSGKGYLRDEVPAIDKRAPVETLDLEHQQWSQVPALKRLASIHNIPDGQYQVRYLPLEELGRHIRSLKDGSIIMVVRENDPNRVVRISHMGFLLKTRKGWVVRHASSGAERKVIEMPLADYLKKQTSFTRWKVVGFALAQPLDASRRVAQLEKRASN